jgi:hypothetical protein
MSGVFGRDELADYRAVGSRAGTMPSVSIVIHSKNQARGLAHAFDAIWGRVDDIIPVEGHSTHDPQVVAKNPYPSDQIVDQCGRGKGQLRAPSLRSSRRRSRPVSYAAVAKPDTRAQLPECLPGH